MSTLKTIPFNTQERKIREAMQDIIVQHMKDNQHVRDEDGDNVVAMVAARSAIIAGVLTMVAPLYYHKATQDETEALTKHVISIVMEFTSTALEIVSDGELSFDTQAMLVSPTDSVAVVADKMAKFTIVPTEH